MKGYAPERVIDRLRELRAGGYHTRIDQVARQARPCPRCRSTTWQADFAWPAGMTDSAIKRLANLYRTEVWPMTMFQNLRRMMGGATTLTPTHAPNGPRERLGDSQPAVLGL
jgi:hypothetical protein